MSEEFWGSSAIVDISSAAAVNIVSTTKGNITKFLTAGILFLICTCFDLLYTHAHCYFSHLFLCVCLCMCICVYVCVHEYMCLCVYMCVWVCLWIPLCFCGGQRTTFLSQVFSSTMRVPEIKFGPSGLVANAFTQQTISTALLWLYHNKTIHLKWAKPA